MSAKPVRGSCIHCGQIDGVKKEWFWAAKQCEERGSGIHRYYILKDLCEQRAPVCERCAAQEKRDFPVEFGCIAVMLSTVGVPMLCWVLVDEWSKQGWSQASMFIAIPLVALLALLVVGGGPFVIGRRMQGRPFGAMVAMRHKVPKLRKRGYAYFGEGKKRGIVRYGEACYDANLKQLL